MGEVKEDREPFWQPHLDVMLSQRVANHRLHILPMCGQPEDCKRCAGNNTIQPRIVGSKSLLGKVPSVLGQVPLIGPQDMQEGGVPVRYLPTI